jgi:hypothetical protein
VVIIPVSMQFLDDINGFLQHKKLSTPTTISLLSNQLMNPAITMRRSAGDNVTLMNKNINKDKRTLIKDIVCS